MSAARVQHRASYAAERTEAGGWRITLPLECCPSSNATALEHWATRKRRVDSMSGDLLWLRLSKRLPEPVFERAALTLTLYFGRGARRDPANYGAGAGGKRLVDALTVGTRAKPRSGWIRDDRGDLLLTGEPVLCVDREWPRVVVTLEPWDGKR